MDIIDYNLKRLSNKFPVPADCPAYLKTAKVRKMPNFNPDYMPYIGALEWCVKCCIYGTYCDGHVCKPSLETKEDTKEEVNMDELKFDVGKSNYGKWQVQISDDEATSQTERTSLLKLWSFMLYILRLWKPGDKFTVTVRRE